MSTARRAFLQAAKWIWLALVLGAIAYYVIRNFEAFQQHLTSIAVGPVLLSMVLLFAGKLLLVEQSRLSLLGSGWRPEFLEMLYINAVTQMGKYIPGGVWHLAGRVGLYRINGVALKAASTVVLVENGWLVGAAIAYGAILLLLRGGGALAELEVDLSPAAWAGLAVLLGLVWVIGLAISGRLLRVRQAKAVYTLRLLALQIAIWTLLGASLWVMFLPAAGIASLPQVLGSFSLSYAVGYAAIFAPGGIGIREAGLLFLLDGAWPASQILAIITINRLVWVVVEVMLGFGAELLLARRYPVLQQTKESAGDV